MTYVEKLLSRGEEIVFESRQHWFALIARSWLWLLALVLGVTLLIWWGSNRPPDDNLDRIFGIGIALLILLPVLRVALLVWAWRNEQFLVTTRRIMRAEGIFNKHVADSNLEKINDARLSQSLLGRVFDYGTLDILTAAEEEGMIDDFPMMAEPVKFKIAMLNQKEMLERPDLARPAVQRGPPPPAMQQVPLEPPRSGSGLVRQVGDGSSAATAAPAATPATETSSPPAGREGIDSLADTLERLGQLRDRGLITQEEFDSKKRQLLERM